MQLYTGPDCYPIGLDRGQAQRMAVDLLGLRCQVQRCILINLRSALTFTFPAPR